MNWKEEFVLVTGGAGFIGSNLCETLLELGAKVRCMDNLLTGRMSNIEALLAHPRFEFFAGDICSQEDCEKALDSITRISHQAALGSVPRSIEFPHRTHEINASGFLTMLHAAKEKNIKRFVYASSSSVYGDAQGLPKVEGQEGNPISPYAVTKKLNEQYAKVYHQIHGMEVVGLRYFNVFGKNQDPNGVYAAAIPKFLNKLIHNEEVLIHGDGLQTRDFTYVKNAVSANVLALSTNKESAVGTVYNVACGDSFSLIEVIEALKIGLSRKGINSQSAVVFGPERSGDVKHSLASISHISEQLAYKPLYTFQEGIDEYIQTF